MRNDITSWMRLIESLAATTRDSDWASDIETRLRQIEDAVAQVRRELSGRYGGER